MKARIALAVTLAFSVGTAWLLACGPFFTDLRTVQRFGPARVADFNRGELGIVRPDFARRHLVQAYRMLSGLPPLTFSPSAAAASSGSVANNVSPVAEWTRLANQVLGPSASPADPYAMVTLQWRVNRTTYSQFLNCPDDAFASAVKTLHARVERYGERSREVSDWTRAQKAVFANCGGETLTLPEPAAVDALAEIKADRAYQTAAAYFYAMRYDEAAARFREVAADRASPWRPYGSYLAARAAIRLATVPDQPSERSTVVLTDADAELQRVLADADSAPLHASARGLRAFVALRLRPVERLHELSRVLSGPTPAASEQDLIDYTWLMDRFLGNDVVFFYGAADAKSDIKSLAAMIADDDLTDWITAMQGVGEDAAARARFHGPTSVPWIVASLWKATPGPTLENVSLEQTAASEIPPTSPAYPTVVFLRARLLALSERGFQARVLLARLPTSPAPGFSSETLNLIKAERLLLAETLDEFLVNAPRAIVNEDLTPSSEFEAPIFDGDAAVILNERLPLDWLVDAALSTKLPDRLRLQVGVVAFARAVVLQRPEVGLRVAPVLRALAPAIRGDLARYVNARSADERQRAGILMLLRTPGMSVMLPLEEDDASYTRSMTARTFDHVSRRNWWCDIEQQDGVLPAGRAPTPWIEWFYLDGLILWPSFMTDEKSAVAAREHEALARVRTARVYLAGAATNWARTAPNDPNAAEALALAVEGWRWSCGDDDRWAVAQAAFDTLHRQFPKSDAAKRTKYWYK